MLSNSDTSTDGFDDLFLPTTEVFAIGIDPGTTQSGWCAYPTPNTRDLVGVNQNTELLDKILTWKNHPAKRKVAAIEFIDGVFGGVQDINLPTTLVWVGRFTQRFRDCGFEVYHCKRSQIKKAFSVRTGKGSSSADSQVIAAMLNRFNNDKGNKKNPGLLYGFKSHAWQALACVSYLVDELSINDPRIKRMEEME